ncbi:MAG TPA: tRNA preQ1(34) S-adenosylmethionine ribosyltransferase-isomerase QueA [Gemmatimonadaceae bacterium]|nr:tRNA preQ1(34) S-adenosylmethionine ribosyltransferase-isomerase QueA [Gemmatimonadaceae bacterium]
MLPPDRIAQHPSERRGASRLLIVDRATGELRHGHFSDIASLISPGDVLVVNTTRVIRARLLGTRQPSGAAAEVLLLKPVGDADDGTFEALVHPGGKLRPGRSISVADDLTVEIVAITDRRTRIVRLHTPSVAAALERYGHVPLPPYIARADTPIDSERYQTVYASEAGSVAAPTAGLHFTHELLTRLAERGVERADVVLHVGAGTFKPVETDDPADHVMHEEWFTISEPAAETINAARARNSHVWAVGTTAVRTLESAVDARDKVRAATGETRLFIRPPYTFRAVDRLLTNFHLPRSTLLMLVAAFAGYDLTMHAYRTAIDDGYRFYSYGDAMLIL